MGKGGDPKVQVTFYYMSVHYGVCIGPVDALLGIRIKEKLAWSGEQTALGQIAISQRELFGGDQKEGGAIGVVHYLPGASDQLLPDALAQRLGRANGADCPGFRGITSLFFYRENTTRGFYWTANTPYLPGVWATVRRAPVGLDPTYAMIPRAGETLGSTLEVTWWQHSRAGNVEDDNTGLEFAFFDANGALIGTPVVSGGAPCETWTERTLSSAIPAGAASLRITIDMDRSSLVNVGGFVDDISATIDGEPLVLANPGAEEGDATGWTVPEHIAGDLVARSADPLPHSGSYYFAYSNQDDVTAYQEIGIGPDADANPAHIIYECLTNTVWGMGSPAAAIDTDSFEDAGVTLYGENFGLSLLWTRQSTIQDFVQEILDHIQGVLYVDPATGLLTLKLIRDDYDAGTLPELTPDNADLSSFGRKLWGEIVNEIVVTWTNPENEQEETVTAHDLASIAMQGGVVSDSRNYYGVRNADLAQRLAWRDLRSAGQPLASCEAEVDRSMWALRPASVVKLTWPEYGLSEIVMRVMSVDYGRPGDPTIKLSLVEDVYGLDIGTYEAPPTSEWVDPSADPEPLEIVDILTLPYFLAIKTAVAAYTDSQEYPEVVAGVLATTSLPDTFEYQLWNEVTLSNGTLEWQNLGARTVLGYGVLGGALAAEATSTGVSFDDFIGNTSPVVGGFVVIGDDGETGNELAMIDAIAGTYTLVRGVLDTVPRAWPAGTPCWFVDADTVVNDPLVRAGGETVEYKLRSRTSLGLLTLGSAPLESATLSDRPWLPSRPANVTAFGEAWSSEIDIIDARARPDPWVTVTWANRNRLTEDSQVLAWTDSTVTPETGQTTRIEVRSLAGALVTMHDDLAGTSFDVPDASFLAEPFVELRVYSKRSDGDGDFVSLQYFSHWLWVGGDGRMTETDDVRFTESGARRLLES